MHRINLVALTGAANAGHDFADQSSVSAPRDDIKR